MARKKALSHRNEDSVKIKRLYAESLCLRGIHKLHDAQKTAQK
jgi:hypothetical protein